MSLVTSERLLTGPYLDGEARPDLAHHEVSPTNSVEYYSPGVQIIAEPVSVGQLANFGQ